MKKMFLVLAILLSTMSVFAGEKNVDPKVLESFKTEFASAKEVNWTAGETYFKADFIFNEQYVSAYYSKEGELIGLTRYISSLDLPLNLQTGLKNSYGDCWISDLFEMTKSNSTTYYITVENADTRLVLKAGAGENWSVYKKTKKA